MHGDVGTVIGNRCSDAVSEKRHSNAGTVTGKRQGDTRRFARRGVVPSER